MAGNVSGLHTFAADVGPESLSLLDGNFSPLEAALNSLNNFSNYYVDSGTVNNMVCSILANQTVTLAAGLEIQVTAAATNTSTTPTLNLATLGAKPIVDTQGNPLALGAIVSGGYYTFIYDGANWRLQNPATFATNVVIGPPASGVALTVDGVAGAYAEIINGSSTSGQSFGLNVHAGTTSADVALGVTNQAATQNYFVIWGDGEAFVAAPTASGTPPSGCWQVGYADMPTNPQTSNYTLALSDRGKQIVMNSVITVTIPANSSVSFPVGTVLCVVNRNGSACTIAITTDTLVIGGTTTGGPGVSRTLSQNGIATLMKITSNNWLISGPGVS
jgi:hypothetical protein